MKLLADVIVDEVLKSSLSSSEEKEIVTLVTAKTGVDIEAKLKHARDHGVQRQAEPTYPANEVDVEEARIETRRLIDEFFKAVDKPKTGEIFRDFDVNEFFNAHPPVHAICISTGVGKTSIVIEVIAERIKAEKARLVVYAVPRHKLGEKIEEQFAVLGIDARIFRGRDAADPHSPEQKMCLNAEAVELAIKLQAKISASCCKNSEGTCRFYGRCGYQRQMPGKKKPEVWIVASDMLFHSPEALGNPNFVIIDEAVWNKGVHGTQDDQKWSVAIDSMIDPDPNGRTDVIGRRTFARNWLASQLLKQSENGGFERRFLEDTGTDIFTGVISDEWKCLEEFKKILMPGMTDAAVRKLSKDRKLMDDVQHSRRIIKIWEAVREMVAHPEIEISGRLVLDQENGQRVVTCRGVSSISKRFCVPTLLLDATMPSKEILQIHHPHVEVACVVNAKMPEHVAIRQVLASPTSSTKLRDRKHLEEVRRYIIQRYLETGREHSLVVCQERVEDYLMGKLPQNISIEHYKNVSGIDAYRDVRLSISIGRPAPGPGAMEDIAGALSGSQPYKVPPNANGFHWYEKAKFGIRLKDGTGVETVSDLHPDPLVEAVRWQINEGELIQAAGRARGVNRKVLLSQDFLFDNCLPLTVGEVRDWRLPSMLVETALDGVMLTSPVDMMLCWPELWPNRSAAKRTIAQGVPELPGFEMVAYRLAGPKMKRRVAWFDRTVIPDPLLWLRSRLGPLERL